MKKIGKNLGGWLISIGAAFLIVFLLKTFIGMPTTVKGNSMIPSFFPEQKLWISTWSTNFKEIPERGSIVTFEAPSVELVINNHSADPKAIYYDDNKNIGEKLLHYGLGITKKSYIKRVIGVPGDHVEIKNEKVYVNGEELKEDYLNELIKTDMSLGGTFDDIIVPDGYIYVLGDNRTASSDSRRFGCIPIDKIEGKVVCRWWPMGSFEIM